MTSFVVRKSRLQGSIAVPPSKSHTMRALLLAMMGKGKSLIHNYLHSSDVEAMILAISQFGAKVTKGDKFLQVLGAYPLKTPDDVIDAKNSGQILRFVGGFSALLPTYTIITGDRSIRYNRPVTPLIEGLNNFGATAYARGDGFAPIIVQGPVTKDVTTLSGEDSQPVSALLMMSSFLKQKSTILVSNPGEKPWIDLTLFWLRELGIDVENKAYQKYIVPGFANFDGFEKEIAGDFSSAAYPIAAALITDSELRIKGLRMDDPQGDKKLVNLIIKMGGKIEIDDKGDLIIKKGSKLKGVSIDLNDMIDAVTILAVIACFAEGKTHIYNARIARKKESDRLKCITSELAKMGGKIEEGEDSLTITPSKLRGAQVNSHSDHRIALSLSVAALAAKDETKIDGCECIAKSYATFKEDFQAIGGSIL